MLLQTAGQQMFMLALGYYTYELTGSYTRLGVVIAAMGIPGVALGLFGGALGDRMEKKRIIQVGQVLLALLGLLLALSVTWGLIIWQHLLAAAFIHGAIMAFVWPVRQAIIPQLVSKELVMNAAALNSMAISVMTMTGPAVAGALIAVVGIESLYYVIAGVYAMSMVLVARLPKVRDTATRVRRSILIDIAHGLQYIRRDTVVLLLLFLGMTQMTLMVPIRFIMPVFAKDVFGVGPEGLGVMMSAMGLGSLVGALVIASLGRTGRRGLLLIISGIVSGTIVLGFSAMSYFVPVFGVAIVLMCRPSAIMGHI